MQNIPIPTIIFEDKNKTKAISLKNMPSDKNNAYIIWKFRNNPAIFTSAIITSGERKWKLIGDADFLRPDPVPDIDPQSVAQMLQTYRNIPNLTSFVIAVKRVKSHTEPRLLMLVLEIAISHNVGVQDIEYVYIHTRNSPCDACNVVLEQFLAVFRVPTFVTYNRGYRKTEHLKIQGEWGQKIYYPKDAVRHKTNELFLQGKSQGVDNPIGSSGVAHLNALDQNEAMKSYVLAYV